MDTVYELEHEGLTAKIFWDNDPDDPRNWGSPFTMACFHRRYNLGDAHDFGEPSDLEEFVARKDVYALPLYLYDHSGITMSTGPFSCSWDSGQVGQIYITAEDARREFGWKRITRAREEFIYRALKSDVAVYDQYISGQVYGYIIEDADGEELDSCWGFYGDESVRDHVQGQLEHYAATLPRQHELAI